MFNLSIGPEEMVEVLQKAAKNRYVFQMNGHIYKLNESDNEGLMRGLATELCKCSDLPEKEYISVEYGIVGTQGCCRWISILNEGEQLINLYELYKEKTGKDYLEDTKEMTIHDRWDYLLAFFKDLTGLDLFDYMAKIVTLDIHLLNCRKVLLDMYVIRAKDSYRVAPISISATNLLGFCFGYDYDKPVAENLRLAGYEAIDARQKELIAYFGVGFLVDRKQLMYRLAAMRESKERDLLLYRLATLPDRFYSSKTYDYLIEKYRQI